MKILHFLCHKHILQQLSEQDTEKSIFNDACNLTGALTVFEAVSSPGALAVICGAWDAKLPKIPLR